MNESTDKTVEAALPMYFFQICIKLYFRLSHGMSKCINHKIKCFLVIFKILYLTDLISYLSHNFFQISTISFENSVDPDHQSQQIMIHTVLYLNSIS